MGTPEDDQIKEVMTTFDDVILQVTLFRAGDKQSIITNHSELLFCEDYARRLSKEVSIILAETIFEGGVQNWLINGQMVTEAQVNGHRERLSAMSEQYLKIKQSIV